MRTLLTPKEAAPILGMTPPSITRMVKLGAPIHPWGPTGYRYKIDPDEWMEWMDEYHKNTIRTVRHTAREDYMNASEQGPVARKQIFTLDTAQMQQRRRDLVAALCG